MPASMASSSRRRPGTRRFSPAGRPASSGRTRDRAALSSAASASRFSFTVPGCLAAPGAGEDRRSQARPVLPRAARSTECGVMTTESTTVLITGANKGLGLETARRLAALGWTVWMAARDTTAATEAADKLRADRPDADLRVVRLDVT